MSLDKKISELSSSAALGLDELYSLVQTIQSVNIVNDFGAVPSDGNSDVTAFNNFNTWAIAQTLPVVLTVPAGTYVTPATPNWQLGIKSLTINGTGSVFNDPFFIGGYGTYQDCTNHRAAIDTVAAGVQSVKLKTLSEYALFTVGQWVLLSCLDMQGYGYPQNPYYFEFAKIRAISSVTGTVTFDAPLRNAYKSTYPVYAPGTPPFDPDEGGPAKIHSLHPSWDIDLIMNGVTCSGAFDANGGARTVALNDCNFSGLNSTAPSQGRVYNATRSVFSTIELDKCLERATFKDCTIATLLCQSAGCAEILTIDGGVITALNGTSKNTTVKNACQIGTLALGVITFGMAETFVASNSVIAALNHCANGSLISDFTYTNGVLRKAGATAPISWAVPGAHILYASHNMLSTFGRAFTILDVAKDGADTVVTTDGPAALLTFSGQVPDELHVSPCWDVTVNGCTGCPEIVELSTATDHRPLFEYINRTLTGNFGAQDLMRIWGILVELRVNVTAPYTGVRSTLTVDLAPIGVKILNMSTHAVSLWAATINLKIAGERVITPSGVTGAQSGDTLTSPGAIWFTEGLRPVLSADIGSESASTYPTVTITLRTDQVS